MKRRLALALAAGLLASSFPHARAEEPRPHKILRLPTQTQPMLVSGTEFVIVEVPVPKKMVEPPQKKMPIVIVVFFWIVAMFLWQVYLNRKEK
jgi:hypothetical protein